jgi:predicted nucleic acid-binding protein
MPSQDPKRLRLFLDSNVLTGGIIARWGLDRAVLSLCASRICRLVLADAVKDEVEGNLLLHATKLEVVESEKLLDDYTTLIGLAKPEIVPYPSNADVIGSRRLIAHQADVPVLLSAIQSQPHWLLTHNRKHFTPAVAERDKLRIGSPADFFRALAGTGARSAEE